MDVINGVVLFAKLEEALARFVFLGLSLGAGLAGRAEEGSEGALPKPTTKDVERAWSISEASGDLGHGTILEEIGAERFVESMGRQLGMSEEPSPLSRHITYLVNLYTRSIAQVAGESRCKMALYRHKDVLF
jgi:hypothetical protein